MKKLTISFDVTVDEDDDTVDTIESIVVHHLDYLVDFDSFPEIKDYGNAKAEIVEA